MSIEINGVPIDPGEVRREAGFNDADRIMPDAEKAEADRRWQKAGSPGSGKGMKKAWEAQMEVRRTYLSELVTKAPKHKSVSSAEILKETIDKYGPI